MAWELDDPGKRKNYESEDESEGVYDEMDRVLERLRRRESVMVMKKVISEYLYDDDGVYVNLMIVFVGDSNNRSTNFIVIRKHLWLWSC